MCLVFVTTVRSYRAITSKSTVCPTAKRL